MRSQNGWKVESSIYAKKTFNPIRNILQKIHMNPCKDKHMIALSIGDPTIFGNLRPSHEITDALLEIIKGLHYNGYAPCSGYESAREAVAKYCSVPGSKLDVKDVILSSGCSSALDICITGLCSPGQTLLVPRPGFPLYTTLAEGLCINTKHYDLLPDKNWQADLKMLEEAIDSTTAAIVVNNPSNPCGSVYSKEHLKEILAIAAKHKLPIIADEIYDNFVFSGQEFHWLASLTDEVPILSCGGLTKRYLVPGWRMGWICIHDRNGIFEEEARAGLNNLTQRIIGSNTLVQGALPDILEKTPQSFFDRTIAHVESMAHLSFDMLSKTPGLKPIMPQGAMYMMVGIDMDKFPDFNTDLEFVERMIAEESVFCLPGKCFSLPNFVRIVLTVPDDQMKEACDRIKEFCTRHYRHHVPFIEEYDDLSQKEKLIFKDPYDLPELEKVGLAHDGILTRDLIIEMDGE